MSKVQVRPIGSRRKRDSWGRPVPPSSKVQRHASAGGGVSAHRPGLGLGSAPILSDVRTGLRRSLAEEALLRSWHVDEAPIRFSGPVTGVKVA